MTKAPTAKDTNANIKNLGSLIFIFLNIILLKLLYHKIKNNKSSKALSRYNKKPYE
jgi:hypothetical protein